MSLIRRTFADDIRDMNRLMGRFFVPEPARETSERRTELAAFDWTPAVDVEENEEAYVIQAELPQVNKEDVKINIQDGVLTLTGERHQKKEERGKRYHRVERTYGSFSRAFRLPDNVDETKIVAAYEDGMLNIHLPKTEAPKHNVREIAIG